MDIKEYFNTVNKKVDEMTDEEVVKLLEDSGLNDDFDCSKCHFTEANACADCCKDWDEEYED